jgi:hypothetical protein
MQTIQIPVAADLRIEGYGLWGLNFKQKKNARNIPATALNVSRSAGQLPPVNCQKNLRRRLRFRRKRIKTVF